MVSSIYRRFGPVKGAGVVIEEREGTRQIEPGALGTTVMVGILEKGQVGEMILTRGKRNFERRCGGRIPESLVPDNAFDFLEYGRGAGNLYMLRVTHGDEVAAETYLYDRKADPNQVIKVTAKNGGRWGGKRKVNFGDVSVIATDITETTIDTGITMLEDEWVGGRVALAGVTTKTYEIISNTVAGVITVTSDSTMYSDLTGGLDPTNKHFILTRANDDKQISLIVRDGALNPTTEWGLDVYVDGDITLSYADLSSDPNSTRYFVDVINDDPNNYEIEVTDLWTGAITADVRPQNIGGVIPTGGITANVLTFEVTESKVIGTGNGTVGSIVLGATAQPDVLELTCTNDTTPGSEVFSVESTMAPLDDMPDATVGVAYTAINAYSIGFTITAGTSNFVIGDKIYIYIFPLEPDAYINGWLIPDVDNYNTKLLIADNTLNSITVASGITLTDFTAVAKTFRAEGPTSLGGGYDGVAGITAADYQAAFDLANSPIKNLFNRNLGLIKIAVPGISTASVQKTGTTFCEEYNCMFRVELPLGTVSEDQADIFFNVTIGKSDLAVGFYPTYGYIQDPDKDAGKKAIPMTGAILGREALTAQKWDGYQKAAAGIDVTLPHIVELPTGEILPDEEFLNPRGINVIKWYQGEVIIWGDKTLSPILEWKWKHQRELMTHYERILSENFDWIIFSINDPLTEDEAYASLSDYFMKEYVKRALQGDKFSDACKIKIDSDINTPATRANGDLYAEITLWLADTVERFIISIGKTGIVETVSPVI